MSDVKFRNKSTGSILIPQSDSIIKEMKRSDRYEEIKEVKIKSDNKKEKDNKEDSKK